MSAQLVTWHGKTICTMTQAELRRALAECIASKSPTIARQAIDPGTDSIDRAFRNATRP